jgi:hypothetical protein
VRGVCSCTFHSKDFTGNAKDFLRIMKYICLEGEVPDISCCLNVVFTLPVTVTGVERLHSESEVINKLQHSLHTSNQVE